MCILELFKHSQTLFVVSCSSLDGKPHLNRFRAIGASPQAGDHIGLRYPLPNHRPSILVGTFTHRQARLIVGQKFDCRCRDCGWILKRTPALRVRGPAIPQHANMASRRWPSRHPGIRQSSRYSLRFVTVGRDVNVGRADQRSHLFRSDESVDKQNLLFHPNLFRQGLQFEPVAISFTGSDVRVSGARNHVDSVAVTG